MASKDGNGLVIFASVFALLTVGVSVAWYMTWTEYTELEQQVNQLTAESTTLKAGMTARGSAIDTLRTHIGRFGGTLAGEANGAELEQKIDDEIQQSRQLIVAASADTTGTADLNLEAAVQQYARNRDNEKVMAETSRVNMLTAEAQLNTDRVNFRESLKVLQDDLASKEADWLVRERTHREELTTKDAQIDQLRDDLTTEQESFSNYRESKEREMTTLRDEISRQRDTLKKLRAAKFQLENLNFERPAGRLTFVDQASQTAFVDIGSRDKLRVGTTFSVYGVSNAGVGLPQSDRDLKGKLVITEILGLALAKADIVDPKLGEPMAAGDPVYSPIFSPGQAMEIAVVGALDFDGNPGSDREEFRRMVSANGARITLEVTDDAEVIGEDGEIIPESDIGERLTSSTRFVLIGDLGDEGTQDTVQKELNNRIRKLKIRMEEAATDNGVYVLSLSRFLDYIGYSRKSLAWSPTKPFPVTLPNGAKSRSVNASVGTRQSSSANSGAVSGNSRRPMYST